MLRFTSSLIIVVSAVLSISATTDAPEFSAVMVANKPIAANNKNVVAKFYVKGDKVRDELLIGPAPSILIVRPDKKINWLLVPGSKTYREIKGDLREIPFFQTSETVKKMRGIKHVGMGRYDKYTCDNYRRTIKDKKKSFTATMWVARKLNVVVKMEISPPPKQGASVMKLINIREQPQPDSLFELPKGYKRAEGNLR